MMELRFPRRMGVVTALVLALGACDDGTAGPAAEDDPSVTFAADAATLEAAGLDAGALQDSVAAEAQTDSAGPATGRADGAHRPERDRRYRPRVKVAMGAEAVELATRLVGDAPDPEQLRLLDRAGELQREAQAALDAGELGKAMRLAGGALRSALKAVVLPDGVAPDEGRAMAEVATRLLDEAHEAVGDDGTPAEKALLRAAARMRDRGLALLDEGHVRGIAWLWRSAVLSSLLAG